MLRVVFLVLLLAGAPAIARGPGSVGLLDGMFAALGGREAIDRLRSLSVDADCTGPGGSFRTRVESFRPGSVYFNQSADDGTTEIWSTLERTWRSDAEAGARDLDEGVRQFVRSHEFHLLLFELNSRFSNHRPGEARLVGDRRCRSILMEDEAGQPASVCLADSDSLPLALELNPQGAEGPIRITFDDWRRVEGLYYFFAFTLTEGPDRTFTYNYRTVTPNTVLAQRFVPDAGKEKRADQEAILEILRDDRRAHLTTRASLLTKHMANPLIEISNGQIYTRPRSEIEEFFENYFEGVTYPMWEDARPPVIHLSSDLTMAWVARSVRVRRQAPGDTGLAEVEEFASAYTATYEKQGGVWRMTSVTSTFLQ